MYRHLPISLLKLVSNKEQNFLSSDYSPQVPNYQDFQLIGYQIKTNLLYMVLYFIFLLAKISSY